jgi:hypothetical protein
MLAMLRLTTVMMVGALAGCGGDDTSAASTETAASTSGAGATSSNASGSGGASTSSTGATTTSSATGGGGAPECMSVGSSSLVGVMIEVVPQACTFTLAEAAAGIQVDYQVRIDADIDGVVPARHDGAGCGQPGPSGLIVFEELTGNGQQYCLCSEGKCPPPSDQPVTLKKGDYNQSFAWDGVNWMGPSDTGNPKGPPFPPGTYELALSAEGTHMGQTFTVLTTWPIELVP